MSGKNISVLDIPPGLFKDSTKYAAGRNWFSGNQVRWYKDMLAPVGGWQQVLDFPNAQTPIRDMFSWRDHLKAAWGAAGSSDALYSFKVLGSGNYQRHDITPSTLAFNPGGIVGYGRGTYGSGYYGRDDATVSIDDTAQWSFDNFGQLLMAVHSQDGRLFVYDPQTASTVAAPILEAPLANNLVIATEEEHLMLMGGSGNPRRVAWCSQRDYLDWTPTPTNSAGGFDLQSDGTIVGAAKVQGGILVFTNTDVHMIEYLGPPYYYGRRRITDESGIKGKNCVTTFALGAIWVSESNFWRFDGGVAILPCNVHAEVFYSSNLTDPSRLNLFTNAWAQEVWFSYPGKTHAEPDRYALVGGLNYKMYWSLGDIPRTAWLNPVWQDKPIACNGNIMYQHEEGFTADGVSRNGIVFATTGSFEIGDGDKVMRVDRVYPDFALVDGPDTFADNAPGAASVTFQLRQAPQAVNRTYGPVQLDSPSGYTTVRFRARQVALSVKQEKDEFWTLGKLRIRVKEAGKR
jgi:hypothetical protein